MDILTFMSNSPWLTFFLAILLIGLIGGVVESITSYQKYMRRSADARLQRKVD